MSPRSYENESKNHYSLKSIGNSFKTSNTNNSGTDAKKQCSSLKATEQARSESTNHLSLKNSHSSTNAEPKIPIDGSSSKLRIMKTNPAKKLNVIPPRPSSGKSLGKRKNSKNNIGNFFLNKNKTLFLNEDDVDTYISYPPKPIDATQGGEDNQSTLIQDQKRMSATSP